MGPGGAGGDVVCWAESGSKPNVLCRFGVKNARRVSFSGEKRGGCGEKRGRCGQKVENSGEKCKFAGEKKLYHPDEARLFIAASPPVEVTATRSSLLDFVLCFSLHWMHIIYIS